MQARIGMRTNKLYLIPDTKPSYNFCHIRNLKLGNELSSKYLHDYIMIKIIKRYNSYVSIQSIDRGMLSL